MMDQSRQFIAVGLSLIAFSKLIHGKRGQFAALTVVAFLFHESAVFLFTFLIVPEKLLKRREFALVCVTLIFAVSVSLDNSISLIYRVIFTRYQYVVQRGHDASSGFRWIVDVAPMAVTMLLYYTTLRYEKAKTNIQAVQVCSWSALPLRLAGYYSFPIMRMSYYGEAASILVAVVTVQNLPVRKRGFYLAILLSVYFVHWWIIFIMLNANGIMPYRFAS